MNIPTDRSERIEFFYNHNKKTHLDTSPLTIPAEKRSRYYYLNGELGALCEKLDTTYNNLTRVDYDTKSNAFWRICKKVLLFIPAVFAHRISSYIYAKKGEEITDYDDQIQAWEKKIGRLNFKDRTPEIIDGLIRSKISPYEIEADFIQCHTLDKSANLARSFPQPWAHDRKEIDLNDDVDCAAKRIIIISPLSTKDSEFYGEDKTMGGLHKKMEMIAPDTPHMPKELLPKLNEALNKTEFIFLDPLQPITQSFIESIKDTLKTWKRD